MMTFVNGENTSEGTIFKDDILHFKYATVALRISLNYSIYISFTRFCNFSRSLTCNLT